MENGKYQPAFILGMVIMFMVILASVHTLAVDKVDLNGLIQIALDKNVELEMARLQLESARIDYQKSELNNLMANSRLVKLQGELKLAEAEESFKDIRNGIIIDLVGKYLEIIKIKQEIETLGKEIQLEKNRLEAAETQVEIGYKGNLELFEQQTVYQGVRDDLELKKDEFEQKKIMLEAWIGTTLGEDIFEIQLNYPEIWEVKEDEAIEQGIANNIELNFKIKETELAEANLEKARITDVPLLDLQKLELNLKLAELALSKKENELKNTILLQYYSYKQAVKGLEMARRSLRQARENTAIITEQQKAGLISGNDLLAAEVNLLKTENHYITAIINYHLNELRLQQNLGQELEVKIDEL